MGIINMQVVFRHLSMPTQVQVQFCAFGKLLEFMYYDFKEIVSTELQKVKKPFYYFFLSSNSTLSKHLVSKTNERHKKKNLKTF